MLTLKPVSLADANAFVALHHRHHKPVGGISILWAALRTDSLWAWPSPGGLSAGIWTTASPWRSTGCAPTAPKTPAAFSMERRRGQQRSWDTTRSSPTSWIPRTEGACGRRAGPVPGLPEAKSGRAGAGLPSRCIRRK